MKCVPGLSSIPDVRKPDVRVCPTLSKMCSLLCLTVIPPSCYLIHEPCCSSPNPIPSDAKIDPNNNSVEGRVLKTVLESLHGLGIHGRTQQRSRSIAILSSRVPQKSAFPAANSDLSH